MFSDPCPFRGCRGCLGSVGPDPVGPVGEIQKVDLSPALFRSGDQGKDLSRRFRPAVGHGAGFGHPFEDVPVFEFLEHLTFKRETDEDKYIFKKDRFLY